MENDLISRSALLDRIGDVGNDPEDDTTFLTIGQACAIAHKSIVDIVKAAPAVDAVEVVQCKDCKHFLKDVNVTYCDYHTTHACNDEGYCDGACYVCEDDFCSYGERREDK